MSGGHFHRETRPAAEAVAAASPAGVLEAVPAWLKLAVALVIVAGTVAVPVAWFWWHVAVAALLLATMVAGRVPWLPLARRLLWFAPFVAGAAMAALWQGPAGPGWRAVALRGSLCLATMLVFAATTPFPALLAVLRRVRVPALLVTTLMLMHRYVIVLGDEAERMRRARASRTLARARRPDWSQPAGVLGRLFVRASERAERIYLAMCARGWR